MFMNGSSSMRCVLRGGVACALAASLGVFAVSAQAPATAFADAGSSAAVQSSLDVRGADTLQIGGDAFECATVTGLGASKLYADVSVDGGIATKDMEYSFDSADDAFGVVQLNAKASYIAQHSGQVALNFYTAKTDERDGAAPVLSANVYAVCMQVNGQSIGSVEEGMIGIRTSLSSQAEDAFDAPTQIVRGGATYNLVGSGKVKPVLRDGVLYVSYAEVESADTVSASVVYVDEQGNELKRDTYSVEKNTTKSVDVRSTVEVDGKVYTPASAAKSVALSASFPVQRIYCVARAEADKTTREVVLSYVSLDGNALMTDRVNVGAGGFLYAPATAFSQANDGSIMRYVLTGATDSDGKVYTADEAKSLSLSREGASSYALQYQAEGTELTYTVNFALVSDAGSGNTNVSLAKSETAKVSSTQDATINLPETIEQDGVSYKRFGSDASLTYTWADVQAGRALSDTVYYAASDVATPEAYDVTVRYVDAVSGAQIGGDTLTCSADGSALSIGSPATVSADGVTYERLSGQDAAITHRYYDPYRTYTVYYAQPGAMTQGDTVVNRTVVIDGGVRYYTIAGDGTVSTADGATAGGLVATAPYNAVTTANGTTADASADGAADSGNVIAPSGDSAYSERIADSETPLASADAAQNAQPNVALIAGVCAAVAAVIAGAIAFALKKRRSEDDVKGA